MASRLGAAAGVLAIVLAGSVAHADDAPDEAVCPASGALQEQAASIATLLVGVADVYRETNPSASLVDVIDVVKSTLVGISAPVLLKRCALEQVIADDSADELLVAAARVVATSPQEMSAGARAASASLGSFGAGGSPDYTN